MALNASFENKRVLITGAAHGLGRALVERLSKDKAIVIAVDKDADALNELKKDFPSVTVHSVDLSNWNETRRAVDAIEVVDILVNNAGIMIPASFLELTEEVSDKTFGVNFKPIINISQSVATKMIKAKVEGTIVNVSSLGAKYTVPKLGIYSCTKAAVNMLTKSMALELAPNNIRVNAIGPRAMKTRMLANAPPGSDKTVVAERALIKRVVETKEAVDAILFLASPLSTMITGDCLYLDGGISTN